MKKNVVCVLVACLMITLAPAALAAEYEAMPEIDVAQYQPAPKVEVVFESGTIQEIPEEYVLQKDGKMYLAAKAFGFIPGLAGYDQLDNQPVAVVLGIGGGPVRVYLKIQQVGEEKSFFVGNDGNTYLPLRDTCNIFGVQLQLKNNIITLKH